MQASLDERFQWGGGMATQEDAVLDVLTLIGNAIDKLQQSIVRFDDSGQQDGVEWLASAVSEIDAYIERIDEDPVLGCVPVDPDQLAARLMAVRDDLDVVVQSWRSEEV